MAYKITSKKGLGPLIALRNDAKGYLSHCGPGVSYNPDNFEIDKNTCIMTVKNVEEKYVKNLVEKHTNCKLQL